MLQIYHAAPTRSARIVWLCEEMGVPYEVQPVERSREFLSQPSYRDVHPMGKIPALKDGDVTMFESLAIMDYIMAKYPEKALRPAHDHPDFPSYLQWYHFGEATLAHYVTLILGHRLLLPEEHRSPAIDKWATREALVALDAMSTPLSMNEWLLPSGFSAVDISCGYVLLLGKFCGFLSEAPAPVQAYFDRIAARPAWNIATGRR